MSLGLIVHGGQLLLADAVVVHVFADADDAFIVGRTEYLTPGRESFELRAGLRGLEFEAADRLEAYGQDEQDRAVVALRAAPWARGRLDWRGFGDPGFRLTGNGQADLRLLNRSRRPLRDCRRPAGGREPADIAPGAELLVTARAASTPSGQLVICALDEAPAGLDSTRPARRLPAEAAVIFHLPSAARLAEEAG